jgi:dimethylargininase
VPAALTRCPAPTLALGELTFLDRQPIAFDKTEQQHAAYCAARAAAGLEVVTLPAVAEYPDSVFVEDVAVVLDEAAVLTRPGAASRQGEVDLIAPALSRFRPVVPLVPSAGAPTPNPPITLEGGDVLRLGRRLYVGLSSRTNAAGVAALRSVVAPLGYTVIPVPVTGCLHLKTGITALDDNTLLANPAWVDVAAFAASEVLPVPADEPWAANILRLDGGLLANAAYPRTADLLAQRGFAPTIVDVSEFSKAEAGLTCLSLLIA